MKKRIVYDFVRLQGEQDVVVMPWTLGLIKCETKERRRDMALIDEKIQGSDRDEGVIELVRKIEPDFANTVLSATRQSVETSKLITMPNFMFMAYAASVATRFLYFAQPAERAYILAQQHRLLDPLNPYDMIIVLRSDLDSGKASEFAQAIISGDVVHANITGGPDSEQQKLVAHIGDGIVNAGGLTLYGATGEAWVGDHLMTPYCNLGKILAKNDKAFEDLMGFPPFSMTPPLSAYTQQTR